MPRRKGVSAESPRSVEAWNGGKLRSASCAIWSAGWGAGCPAGELGWEGAEAALGPTGEGDRCTARRVTKPMTRAAASEPTVTRAGQLRMRAFGLTTTG